MRRPRVRFTVRGLIATVAILAASAAALRPWLRDRGPLPLSRSLLLRGVAEPVALADSNFYDDNGGFSLRFVDSRGACLDVRLEEGKGNLDCVIYVGSFGRRGGRALAESGVDERALLGLLQRWAGRAGAKPMPWAIGNGNTCALRLLYVLQERG